MTGRWDYGVDADDGNAADRLSGREDGEDENDP